MMGNRRIAVLDIETTGFNPEEDCIVEIGIVELDLFTGKKRLLYDRLICEDDFGTHLKDAWIFNNSDLSCDDVLKHGQTLKSEFWIIQEILDSYMVTAYNSDFDFKFLQYRGFKLKPLLCPMKALTPHMQMPGKYGGYKWPSVEEATRYFFPKQSESYSEAHRGASDAVDEANIIKRMFELGWYPVPSSIK